MEKLKLSRETLRALTDNEGGQVFGGQVIDTGKPLDCWITSNYDPYLCGGSRINCPRPKSNLCNTLNCPADTFGCTVA